MGQERSASRSRHRRCSIKKGVLKHFANLTGKRLYQGLFFNKVAGPQAQVFFCKICKIFKNNFFTEHFRTTAS